jgi:hypothetical protein
METTHRTARVLTERVDALAVALRAAGVDPLVSERLLGSAAAAVMDAVALDLIVADRHVPPAAAAAPAAEPQPVALAA